MTIESLEILTS